MVLYDYFKLKANELGHNCPFCGKNDGFFALNGKCNLCERILLQPYSELKSFLFSVSIIKEFLENYDTLLPITEKKGVIILLEQVLCQVEKSNKMPGNNDIILIQSFLNSNIELGSDKVGGKLFLCGKMPLLTLKTTDGKVMASAPFSLAGIVLAIQFILNLRVKNEIVI